MGYDAFISYSHSADGRLAPALQAGVQRLAKPWYRPRALRVFRDETGLSTNPHLWSSIVDALDESEWFVLLASPEAARSEWVEREIAHWTETKPVERILPVVTHGRWEWDVEAGRLVGDAVPARLADEITAEPRHLDLTWTRDQTDLDLRNSRFRSAVADLAAPMHGIAKDELEGEDIRQHRRARRLARVGVATVILLLVIAVVFGGYAVEQRDQAEASAVTARRATQVSRHRLLVSQSQAELASDRQVATLLAIEADRRKPSAETRDALLDAVLAEPALQRAFGRTSSDVRALDDHRVVALSVDRGEIRNRDIVQVWDWQTGRRVPWPDAPAGDRHGGPAAIATTSDGSRLAVLSVDGSVRLYSGPRLRADGDPVPTGLGPLSTPSSDALPQIEFRNDGTVLAVAKYGLSTSEHSDLSIAVLQRRGDTWVAGPALDRPDGQVTWFDFSRDGSVIATSSWAPVDGGPRTSDISINEVATGRSLARIRTRGATSFALDWERRRVVIATEKSSDPGGPDAIAYPLDASDGVPRPISLGLSSVGYVTVGFDADHSRLGILGFSGFRVLDAATLTPLPGVPTLHPDGVGAMRFLDGERIVFSSSVAGPLSLWDLSGTSALASPTPTRLFPTPDPARLLGVSSDGSDTTVTEYGRNGRPLGPAIPIDTGVAAAPADVAQVVRTATPVACLDGPTGRLATVALTTGDLDIYDGPPPFPLVSRSAGAFEGVGRPLLCAWAPDGSAIAVGTFEQGQGRSPNVALFDVATRRLRFSQPIEAVGIVSLLFSADSRTIYAGGPVAGTETSLFAISDLDRRERTVRTPFPGASGIAADADGRRLVVSSPAAIEVVDPRTRQPSAAPIPLPGGLVSSVSVSPDGTHAVVVTTEGWRLVDLDAGQSVGPVLPPALHRAYLGAAWRVYTNGSTTGGEVWDLAPQHVRDVACQLAGRNLSTREWAKYLAWAGRRRPTCPGYGDA